MDAELEQKVREWKDAKANKDFSTADRIRSELRDAGFDPDKRGGGKSREPDVDFKIQQWQEAKASKDFITADLIRSELRAKGIEPDSSTRGAGGSGGQAKGGGRQSKGGHDDGWGNSAWPPAQAMQAMQHMGMGMPFMGGAMSAHDNKPYDHSVEAELDQWSEARASKDYATADSIRDALRRRGVSPQKERAGHSVQDEVHQWSRAKQARDFTRSDRIRDSLRAQGVNPDDVAKSPMMGGGMQMPMMFGGMGMGGGFGGGASYGGGGHGGGGHGGGGHRGDNGGGMSRPKAVKKENPGAFQNISSMDSHQVDMLSGWFEAKDSKNWGIADSLRDKLRAAGIEPANCQRPGAGGMDDEAAEMIREWESAKAAKNFGIADGIRDQLRARGIEPSQGGGRQASGGGGGYGKAVGGSRGGGRSAPYSASESTHDYQTEAKLDEWWQAKQDKNFALSDTLRSELRAAGIEPEQFRPVR